MGDPGSHRGRSVEYLKCAAHPGYFICEFCMIEDTQGEGGGGARPFRLWPAQMKLLMGMLENPLVFILKARQLGISWLVCAYALWLALFQDGKTVLLLSQRDDEAVELLRRVVWMYRRLPPWLLEYLPPSVSPCNTTTFTLANGSRMLSMPATKNAASGYTAKLVVMDEFAKLPWPNETFTAVKPTIDNGGQLIILSTAQGVGNLFHDLWVRFSAGLTRWKTYFLSWRDRPGRDQSWYDRTLAESNDPAKHKQEYPDTPQEAFQASGRSRFPNEWIERQAANLATPMRAGSDGFPAPLANVKGLSLYRPKQLGHRYAIGADVAEGLEHGDFSAAVVIDRATYDEVASVHGRWEPDEFAAILEDLGRYFNAPIVVERNNHGHAVISRLKALIPNQVGGGVGIALGPDKRYGWLTNATTKPQAIDILAEGLKEGTLAIRTKATLDEMQIYSVMADGKTSAPPGKHDDRVMSWAVLVGWLRLGPTAGSMRAVDNPGG